MIRFYSYLGLTEQEQNDLPLDMKQSGKIIDGMQLIYEEVSSPQVKDQMAFMIAETAQIVLSKLNKMRFNINADKKVKEEIIEIVPEPIKEVEVIQEVEKPIDITDAHLMEKEKNRLFLEHIRKDLDTLEF